MPLGLHIKIVQIVNFSSIMYKFFFFLMHNIQTTVMNNVKHTLAPMCQCNINKKM